jgi:hypothetical protein
LSGTGIYFGFRTEKTPTGVAHFWCSVSFADRGLNAHSHFPPGKGPQDGKPPDHSRVALTVHRFTEPNGKHLHMATPVFHSFPPAPEKGPAPWRKLAVEVTPAAVRVFWEGQLLPKGEISVDQLNELVNKTYKTIGVSNLKAPFTFPPRGALGLLVSGGKASFRNVCLETLRSPASGTGSR